MFSTKNIFTVAVLLLAMNVFAQDSQTLSVQAFSDSVQHNKNAVVIDLRTPAELKGGVIEGATFIDYFDKSFEKRLGKLDPSKTYFIYCATNGRSGETLELLKLNGFKHVYHLSGGFEAWKAAGMPVKDFKPR